MDSVRREKIRSSMACRRRLDDLYMPIFERFENGDFNREGGSDAYDLAFAALKEAYLTTPNLGSMMHEELKTFIDSHTLDPVEVVDLPEPDEEAPATPQQVDPHDFQGLTGRDLDDLRLPNGELDAEAIQRRMQDDFIQRQDPDKRCELKKAFKNKSMDTARKTSSAACRARLRDVFKPIIEGKKNDAYIGEEGHKLYQVHIENAKEAYQNTPEDLGLMKARELDDYLDHELPSHDRLIELHDKRETKVAINKQEVILKKLKDIMRNFQDFRNTYVTWIDNRSDNINWLNQKAESLDKKHEDTNRGIVAATSVSGVSTLAGMAVVSVVLAPVTFGASLAIGLGVGTAAVGLSTGAANFALRKIERTYNLNAVDEAEKRLKNDKEQTDALNSIIDLLASTGNEIKEMLGARRDAVQQSKPTDSDPEEDSNSEGTQGSFELPETDTSGIVLDIGLVVASGATGIGAATARTVKTALEVGDDVANAAKMGVQIADDVVDAAKASVAAAKSLGGLAIAIGIVSLAWDAYTLVKTVKDMKSGSKSELGEKLREEARKLESHVKRLCNLSVKAEMFVEKAEALLTPLMKRYPVTVGHPDMI